MSQKGIDTEVIYKLMEILRISSNIIEHKHFGLKMSKCCLLKKLPRIYKIYTNCGYKDEKQNVLATCRIT